jgi:Ca2+ transporting ATPase
VQHVFEENICCNSISDPVEMKGTATELAMAKYVLACGINSLEYKKKFKIINVATFTSERKRMSTIIEKSDGSHRLYIKGASEYIVESCDKIVDLNSGNIIPLDNTIREETKQAITSFAKKSLRTIGMAYVDLPANYDLNAKDKKKCLLVEIAGLTLIGICGIKDIIRAEVPDAVLKCNRAGISVKMVTGDNKVTARAIAKEVNILEENDEDMSKVIEGPEFMDLIGGVVCKNCKEDKNKKCEDCDCVKNVDELKKPEHKGKKVRVDTIMNGEEFEKICYRICVMARSRPEDKYALVVGLKERGNVVAVTGDGTNDAPALSKADVGFAMGIAGTEVAKQAAAIMLMDDNFTSIVAAVKWGRNIYDSIRKFLMFQLTVNVVAVLVTFVSAATTKEAILSAIQMLWINLIMDTLASLALATEPPTDKLLLRKPHKRDSYIVSIVIIFALK